MYYNEYKDISKKFFTIDTIYYRIDIYNRDQTKSDTDAIHSEISKVPCKQKVIKIH